MRDDPQAPPTIYHSLADIRTWACWPGGVFAWTPMFRLREMGIAPSINYPFSYDWRTIDNPDPDIREAFLALTRDRFSYVAWRETRAALIILALDDL